jgi:predicted AAA+ superfamily ATPase
MAMAGAGDHVPTGWQFETLVANDLLVWRDESPGRTLAHWRTPSGPEVDFILGQGKQFMGIELKVADAVDRHDARHLVTFVSEDPDARTGLLLSSDNRIRMLGERVMAAPWWSVL